MRKLHTLILLLITTAAQAQQPVRLSLKECTDYALKHNYTVRNARIDVLIQEAQVKQTVSASLPHINGKADLTYFNIPQRSFIDASTFPSGDPTAPPIPAGTIVPISFTIPWTASTGITASQLIFDGSVLVALQARKSVIELAQQTEKVTQQTVRYNVFKAYNSLVIAYRQYDIVKSSLGFIRSMARDLEIMRENGFVEKIEVERTTVQLNNLATDSMRIGNMLTVSEQVLKFQIGMDINTPIVLTDTNVDKGMGEAALLLAEPKDYDRLPEYNALKTALRLNEFNLRRYKLAALPTLSGFWSYGVNTGSDEFGDLLKYRAYYPNSTFGLSLTMPIFNGFMRQYQVKEANLNVEKSKNNIDNLKLGLDFQSASAKTNLRNSLLLMDAQRRNLVLASDVLDLAQKKYKAGVGSNMEVVQAQTELLRSQNNYFGALLEVTNAQADLRKALGLLNQ
ncbi:MAG: TolC family protein [Bacteroidota bacterium]